MQNTSEKCLNLEPRHLIMNLGQIFSEKLLTNMHLHEISSFSYDIY